MKASTHTHTHTHNFLSYLLMFICLLSISCRDTELNSEDASQVIGTHAALRSASYFCDFKILEETSPLIWCADKEVTLKINVPEYPDCDFRVRVYFRDCQSVNGNQFYSMLDYSMLDHDCPAYDADVVSASAAGTLGDFSVQMERAFLGATFLKIAQTFGSEAWDSTVFYYSSAACTKYCYVGVKSAKGHDGLIAENTHCGDGCCNYEVDIWFSGKYQDWVVNAVNTNSGDEFTDCDASEIFSACPPNTLHSSDCTFTCENWSL